MKRKKYSPEFKRAAIELVRRSGASCRQVALAESLQSTGSPKLNRARPSSFAL